MPRYQSIAATTSRPVVDIQFYNLQYLTVEQPIEQPNHGTQFSLCLTNIFTAEPNENQSLIKLLT